MLRGDIAEIWVWPRNTSFESCLCSLDSFPCPPLLCVNSLSCTIQTLLTICTWFGPRWSKNSRLGILFLISVYIEVTEECLNLMVSSLKIVGWHLNWDNYKAEKNKTKHHSNDSFREMCYELFFPELTRLFEASSQMVLRVWFPGWGTLASHGSLLEMQVPGPHSRPTEPETQG